MDDGFGFFNESEGDRRGRSWFSRSLGLMVDIFISRLDKHYERQEESIAALMPFFGCHAREVYELLCRLDLGSISLSEFLAKIRVLMPRPPGGPWGWA